MRSARIFRITTYALAGAFAFAATSSAWAQTPDDQQPPPVVQQNNNPPVAQPAPAPQPQPVQQNSTNVYPAQPAPAPQPVYQAQPPPPQPVQTVVEVHGPGSRWESGYLIGEHEYRSAFLFDPGALINGVVDLEYEAALARWLGLALGVSINTYRGAFEPQAQGSFVAFGPEIGLRAHFIQPAPAGLWIGPELAVKYIAWRGTSNPATTPAGATGTANADFAYELGGALGYNFVIDHFLLSLGVGGGFGDYGYGVQWSPRFRLGVGAVF
jgi:hypothetical protein